MADYTILVGLGAMVLGFIWLKYTNDHEPKDQTREVSQEVPVVSVQEGVTVEILEEIKFDITRGLESQKGTLP